MSDIKDEAQLTLYMEGSFDNTNHLNMTAVSLLALFALECCQASQTLIIFVEKPCKCVHDQNFKCLKPKSCNLLLFRVELCQLKCKYKFCLLNECPTMVRNCHFPVVFEESQNYCIVGLCSSLRHILNSCNTLNPNELSNRLLGFRRSCLQACAEVSIWTQFCEIDSVKILINYYSSLSEHANFSTFNEENLEIAENLIRYERHLEHPPIMHNALKHKQENLEKELSKVQYTELKKKTLKELPNLEHKYAEGIDLTLADVLLYVTISLILHKLSKRTDLEDICPLVLKWHKFMESTQCITNGKYLLACIKKDYLPIPSNIVATFLIPNVIDESLYKSDPQRYKPHWRSFTHQEDIESVIQKLNELSVPSNNSILICTKKAFCDNDDDSSSMSDSFKGLSISSSNLIVHNLCFNYAFDWESFPSHVHPIEGNLPVSRIKRKLGQLESIAQIVIDIAERNTVIVDFCAGGGHLGILLAYCLPSCKIILVENKKNSLDKARDRVKALNLENVNFYQCNLDYFNAKFDVGVCLHACGVATDLVMLKCINQKASFVCSPCCYGSIKPNHILSYPRSILFSQEFNISVSEFLILSHAADQTHSSENPKTVQGKKCMQLVDYDRLSFAKSHGYKIVLTTMNPPDSSPKNHILVGLV